MNGVCIVKTAHSSARRSARNSVFTIKASTKPTLAQLRHTCFHGHARVLTRNASTVPGPLMSSTSGRHPALAFRIPHVRPRVSRLEGGATRRCSGNASSNIAPGFPLVSFSRTSGSALGGEAPYAAVFPDVITADEEQALLGELEPVFRRKRYEKGHWDSVIEDYKESERLDGSWSDQCQGIVDSIRKSCGLQAARGAAADHSASPSLPVHAIDLAATGFIRPHVDSVKFSGGTVAGLSLMSTAVMQLSRSTDSDVADLLLPPRSLYVLRGPARFEWAHAILPNDGAPIKWQGREFERGRRISLIFRDELVGSPPEPHPSIVGGDRAM